MGEDFSNSLKELPVTNISAITDTNMSKITVTNMSAITVTNMSAITGQIWWGLWLSQTNMCVGRLALQDMRTVSLLNTRVDNFSSLGTLSSAELNARQLLLLSQLQDLHLHLQLFCDSLRSCCLCWDYCSCYQSSWAVIQRVCQNTRGNKVSRLAPWTFPYSAASDRSWNRLG